MNTFSTWLTAIMLVIFTTMVGIATQYPEDARFMPLLVGIPGIALCVLQLGLDVVRAYDGHSLLYYFRSAPKAGKPSETQGELPEFGPHTAKREWLMWGYVAAFIAAVLLFGFYVAIPIMLLTFLRREAQKGWTFSLLLTGVATAVLYLAFAVVLRIELHPGFITAPILHRIGL